MSLNLTEDLCDIIMEIDAKFEEELNFRFKIDMRNLTNLGRSTQKSQKSAINWCFLSKVYNV